MPKIETSSGVMWYADHRDPTVRRPVTVFIHGAGGTHLDWPAELRRLPEANAIVIDLPGHGRSGGAGRSSVSAYAADVMSLLDALKIPRAILGGHSMGGAICLTAALSYPERVQGLDSGRDRGEAGCSPGHSGRIPDRDGANGVAGGELVLRQHGYRLDATTDVPTADGVQSDDSDKRLCGL